MRHRNIMLGLPITRLRIADYPFGYEPDPDKEGWLRPVQKQLEALWFARKFQRRSSMNELARWVTNHTGRPISSDGLRIIFRMRPPLEAYLLDLDDRFAIATCATEEEAIKRIPKKRRSPASKGNEGKARYNELRIAAVQRKEKAREAKQLELQQRQAPNN